MKELEIKSRINLCNIKEKYYNVKIKSLNKQIDKFKKLKDDNLKELESLTD